MNYTFQSKNSCWCLDCMFFSKVSSFSCWGLYLDPGHGSWLFLGNLQKHLTTAPLPCLGWGPLWWPCQGQSLPVEWCHCTWKVEKIVLQTTRPCALQYNTCASWKLIASGSLLDMGLVCTRLILIVLWLSFKKVLWSLLNLSTTCPSLFYRELIRYLFLKKSHSWTLQMNLVLVSSMLRGMQLARAHNRFNILPLKVLSRQVLLHSWTEDLQTCPFSSAILQEWTKRTTKRM